MKPLRNLFAYALCTAGLFAQTESKPAPNHADVPGVVIAHSPKESRIFLGSAGIAVLPDGTYLAKHDEFGPGATHNTNAITRVYRSTDKGRTWMQISRVENLFWANIFPHRGAVYMMGTSANHRHGYAVIRKSVDGGVTWTEAKDENTGRLFPDISYHTAPMPVVFHQGRIWRAMEDEKGGQKWGESFRAFMLSAPEEADLLKASSWTASNAIPRDASYLGGRFGGWLEGNAVVTPEGEIVDILRVDYRDVPEKAAIVRISADGKTATFDPEKDFIDFPGGCKKFVIRWDAPSKRYWTISNAILPQHVGQNVERVRNAAVLMSSTDLRKWTPHQTLLYHADVAAHGFQYLDWLVEGEDLLVVSRTAFADGLGGAKNQHDSNYLTFHRVKQFRSVVESIVDVAGTR
ncbi:MAG TPA: sialidase family protein [Opitutaceae bacterium]|nr:sialidase family protein [Opitutaceae bacterium]